jgi:hypothetical protein
LRNSCTATSIQARPAGHARPDGTYSCNTQA